MGTQKNCLNAGVRSFECPKCMFKQMGKKIIIILCSHILLNANGGAGLVGRGGGASLCVNENYSYFSTKTYVCGYSKNCLNETFILSTLNVCLNRWVRK